jgi:hypothetical protein
MSANGESVDLGPSGFIIEIIPGRCMGNGNCVTAAEKYFDQDERDGRVLAKQSTVSLMNWRWCARPCHCAR